MRADHLGELEARARRDWGHLGEQMTASGTRCIGRVPHVGWAAWLHRFFTGCPEEELDAAEKRMNRPIPSTWRRTLRTCNGVQLFVARVSLDGVLAGGHLRRSAEDPQPFSLEMSNGLERPRGAAVAADDFVIGGRTLGDPCIYLLRSDGSVVAVTRDGSDITGSWPSAWAMVAAEYSFACEWHDRDGRLVGP